MRAYSGDGGLGVDASGNAIVEVAVEESGSSVLVINGYG